MFDRIVLERHFARRLRCDDRIAQPLRRIANPVGSSFGGSNPSSLSFTSHKGPRGPKNDGGITLIKTRDTNINPRYFKDAKNDFAALGILPFSSKASFGSILQTVLEYHNVRIPATNDHNRGNPL